MSGQKIIHDSVHGSVKVSGSFLEMLHSPEMQRLHGIKQLGLAHLVFPGANHTRFEHSLGTFHIASRMCDSLSLSNEDRERVLCAAMLHDVGHPPFSHTLEEVLEHRFGMDHAELGRRIILGEAEVMPAKWRDALPPKRTLYEIMESEGISPEDVSDIIVSPGKVEDPDQSSLWLEKGQMHFSNEAYLRQMIHGPVDADQMDYLLRDAHYTGVAHGAIDLDRILQTISLFHGDLVIRKGGMVAAEGLMVARALMYTSIYFHKTVRIAEMMLCKAVEMADDDIAEGFQSDDDGSLTQKLLEQGPKVGRIMAMLKYRQLFKRAFTIYIADTDEAAIEKLSRLTDYDRRKDVEELIADRSRLDPSEIIVDVPSRELLTGEMRKGKTEVPILNGDRVRPLTRYSPISRALQIRGVHDWAVMVSCPAENVEVVAKAAERTILG